MQYRDSPVGVHGGKTQLANLVDFQASRGAPDLITIGVGGNDANFGGIIAECILGSCATGDFAERTISTINGSMFRNVRDTLVKLRAGFPAATIVSFGYPSVVDDPAADCVGVTRIGEDERAWIKGKVLSAVNDAVKDAATEAGVVYADITRTTAGHGLCSPDPWINGARFGDDKYIFVANESFHPNQKAHDAIAAYFMEHYTDGANRLLATNPEPSAPIRPGTGPEIRLGQVSAWAVQGCGASCLQPAACIQGCPIHLEGSDFTPGAPMHVVLQGGSPSGLSARASQQPVLVDLGQVTANPAGHVVADLRLPRSVSPGVYSLVLEGTSADGTRQHAVVFVRVYGRLASRITATFGVSRRGTRIRTLRARSLPAGSRVDIACARGAADVARALSGLRVTRRGGCPFTRRTFRVTRAATMRSFAHHFRAWLAPGTVVRVMVTHPDNGGRALDVTVRGRRTPRVSARCSQPGQLVSGPC
jgi:lysophospholipase L1-like esterase